MSELRLLAAVRRTAAEIGAPAPRIGPVDELLDEWLEADMYFICGPTNTFGQFVHTSTLP